MSIFTKRTGKWERNDRGKLTRGDGDKTEISQEFQCHDYYQIISSFSGQAFVFKAARPMQHPEFAVNAFLIAAAVDDRRNPSGE